MNKLPTPERLQQFRIFSDENLPVFSAEQYAYRGHVRELLGYIEALESELRKQKAGQPAATLDTSLMTEEGRRVWDAAPLADPPAATETLPGARLGNETWFKGKVWPGTAGEGDAPCETCGQPFGLHTGLSRKCPKVDTAPQGAPEQLDENWLSTRRPTRGR